MNEIEQLEQAIIALEAQRSILGDAVIEAALNPIREKVASLRSQTTTELRKLVTILIADIVGFTALSEKMDPEDVREVLNSYFSTWTQCIEQCGGRVEKFIGDAVIAVFGLNIAREDDPESAIRSALAMHSELAALNETLERTKGVKLKMRVGIHTGPVVVSMFGERSAGSDGQDFVVVGDTAGMADRLQTAAPHDTILISHDTYRHVRGVFKVLERDAIPVRGRAEPFPTYLVQSAKPRAFRLGSRGIEGIETRTIGRELELKKLQDIYQTTLQEKATQVVTIRGEAGVGKSRLLFEFSNWLELRPEFQRYFKGRAGQQMSSISYGLARDLFDYRFEIFDSDPASVAREKLERGVQRFMGLESTEKAHLIGHLIGLDFSSSPYLSGIVADAKQIHDRGFHYTAQFFRAVSDKQAYPVIVFLEDVHWADDGSLDLINYVAQECQDVPMLIICLARPTLYERRPLWGSDQSYHSRITLEPLSAVDSHRLVNEILQKMENVPQVLRKIIINEAEGNPFYMEEMVKMLIDDGVILKGHGQWRVISEKLVAARVPPTLTGILQARLDSLPLAEKTVLQRASVVGRVFWDGAVTQLGQGEDLQAALQALSERELVFEREASTFAGAKEYIFKHTVLHEVTYESVLKKLRREYHKKVAEWLVKQSGERVNEFSGLIADHYERGGEAGHAVTYLQQAGEQALRTGAPRDAIGFFDRALSLLHSDSPLRVALLGLSGEAYRNTGNYSDAAERLEKGRLLAEGLGDRPVLAQVHMSIGEMANEQGQYATARTHFEGSLSLARGIGDKLLLSKVLYRTGFLAAQQGDLEKAEAYVKESLELARQAGDRQNVARALNGLGVIALNRGEHERTIEFYEGSLSVAREIGDRQRIASQLGNLGFSLLVNGNYSAAQAYLQESLQIFQDIGDRFNQSVMEVNLGHALRGGGSRGQAWEMYLNALRHSSQLGATYVILEVIAGLADLLALDGQPERAVEWLGLVLNHPSAMEHTRMIAQPIFARLEVDLGQAVYQAALARGKMSDLNSEVRRILDEGWIEKVNQAEKEPAVTA